MTTATAEKTDLVMVEYSEHAIAIFGDTKPHRRALVAIHGRFNPRLKQDGQQTPGWVFSKKHRAAVEAWLKSVQS